MNDAVLWLFMHTADPWMLLLAAVASGGLGLHPVERIINVHWGGGLAVEFDPGEE
jgi:hypothetical protein